MNPIHLVCHSPLEKIDPFQTAGLPPVSRLFGIPGQTLSIQVACTADSGYTEDLYTCISADCPGCTVALFRVEPVPCTYPCGPAATGAYLTRTPALIPDALIPYSGQPVRHSSAFAQIFWLDITIPHCAPSTAITICAHSRKGALQGSITIPLTVAACALPPQSVRHTEWLHCDCLCQAYGCEMFSPRFWQILKNYLTEAAAHGIDTLLTPVITPSLDIEPNCRRMPCQLVAISEHPQGLHFDFSNLEKWVSLAQECGIRYFEIAPFFTQWGAQYAAEIYFQTPDGPVSRFGWDTPAFSDDFRSFLGEFLPALVQELKNLSILQHTYFHISDEPSLENMENYRTARNLIAPYLQDCRIIDALSDHRFWEEGLVSIPVVSEDHLAPFLPDTQEKEIWTYFCCAQDRLVPNVFLSMPTGRGRIIGALLYVEHIRGFLHWGYNFWSSQFSKSPIDPYRVTDADGGFPSGDGFLVYPGADGAVVPSIRLKALRDGFQDHRSLCLLESKVGRQAVLDLIFSTLGHISFTEYPVDPQVFAKFEQALCSALGTI